VIIGITALANDSIAPDGSESDFDKMTKAQKQVKIEPATFDWTVSPTIKSFM